ncbi:uncharacterized protein LOC128610533 [Ictalurus furcatus]|uniref:uncharacterized protein LOC128610533 n=1 Tax=Ictalurus furcatus TaxID=66913 RepID=UPI00234FF95E|nr:uncharacterized protein LOC128610533 [Ictalurus furcatus]
MSVFISSPSSSSSFICIIIIIMFCCSLLLVLLVLAYLQSITTANNANGPDRCCFSYQTHPIPVRCITAYEKTERQCQKPGVIFTLKSGRHVCANPRDQWVQKSMKIIHSHSFTSWVEPKDASVPWKFCFRYQTHRIPVRLIIAYRVTDPHCSNPGVIFTLKSGRHVCANPRDQWVQKSMKIIDSRSFTSWVEPKEPDKSVPPPSPIRNDPDKPVSTASSNIEPTSHPAQQDYMQEMGKLNCHCYFLICVCLYVSISIHFFSKRFPVKTQRR